MTSLRTELVRTLVVLSAPLGVLAVFPYSALSFAARRPTPAARPYVAFVHLTDAECDAALRAAKSAWQMEGGALRDEQAWLPLGELPEETTGPILPFVSSGRHAVDWPRTAYAPPAWLPSVAAAAPAHIGAEPEKSPPPFTREELLRTP